MPDKSFADLLREAGVQPSGAIQYAQSLNRPVPYRSYTPPRPLPRRMRPADVRAYDDNAGVAQQALSEMRRDRMTGQDAMLREAQGPASNQFADAGMVALETTGVPALRRSYDAFEAGDPRQGIYEGIWGGLGLAGTLGAIPGARRGAPRLPTREPVLPQMREPPAPPPGSVLPVRPLQPFRQSLIGGADDLTGASRGVFSEGPPDGMPPAPPQSLWQHGTLDVRARQIERDGFRVGPDGFVWMTDSSDLASAHGRNQASAARSSGVRPAVVQASTDGLNLKEVDAAGRNVDTLEFTRDLESQYDGVLIRNAIDGAMGNEPATIVGVRENAAPRIGNRRMASSDGSPDGMPPRAPDAGNGRAEQVPEFRAMTERALARIEQHPAIGAPDGGARVAGQQPYVEQLAAEGFTVPAYRGMTKAYDEAEAARRANPNAPWHRAWTQWFTDSPEMSGRYAMREYRGEANLNWDIDSPNVFPAMLRMGRNVEIDASGATAFDIPIGRIRDRDLRRTVQTVMQEVGANTPDTEIIAEAARRNGYDTITLRRVRDPLTRGENNAAANAEQTVYGVLSRAPGDHIRSRFGPASDAPTAGPSRPPPDTAKSYRPGPPKGGFFFSRRR